MNGRGASLEPRASASGYFARIDPHDSVAARELSVSLADD